MSNIAIQGAATGTGVFTLASPATNTNRTLTLPDEAGTVLTSASSITQNAGPAFSAYMSATYQSISPNTHTKVVLDAELFDSNGNYDTSNYRWTPTVEGYYQINAAVGVSYLTAVMNGFLVSIYKNGSSYLEMQSRVNSQYGTGAISQLVYMNGSTDYLELWGYSVGGTDPVFQGSTGSPRVYQSWFSGVLVRAA
jgi:hypothetical protein